MNLILCKDLKELVDDLIVAGVVEKENYQQFLDEFEKEKVVSVFFDTNDGLFLCYMWLKNKAITKEYEIIESLCDAWANYCNIDDTDILKSFKTCSLLNYSILKSLE